MFTYKYQKLAETLKNQILTSYAEPGTKIPTESELCEQFKMSRNTVRQAVGQLVENGFLRKVQGCGTFVSEKVTEYIQKQNRADANRSIGVVMNTVDDYIFPSVLTGISDYLFKHDYRMMIRMTHNRICNEKRILEEMLGTELAGLIIEPARSSLPQANTELYREIEKNVPCVLINAELPGFSFPTVDTANVEGYELLVDHLVENGHKEIAAIFKFDEQTGVKRYQGFVRAMLRHNLNVDERRIVWYRNEDFESLFSGDNSIAILSAIRNCTAVMCFNDELAERFLPFLTRHGLEVPDDISIVAFDDCWSSSTHQPVTTILHPKEVLGKTAAKAALDLVRDPLAKVSHIFPPTLVNHKSVRRIIKTPPLGGGEDTGPVQ